MGSRREGEEGRQRGKTESVFAAQPKKEGGIQHNLKGDEISTTATGRDKESGESSTTRKNGGRTQQHTFGRCVPHSFWPGAVVSTLHLSVGLIPLLVLWVGESFSSSFLVVLMSPPLLVGSGAVHRRVFGWCQFIFSILGVVLPSSSSGWCCVPLVVGEGAFLPPSLGWCCSLHLSRWEVPLSSLLPSGGGAFLSPTLGWCCRSPPPFGWAPAPILCLKKCTYHKMAKQKTCNTMLTSHMPLFDI